MSGHFGTKTLCFLHKPHIRAFRRFAGAGWKPNETTAPTADSEVAPSIECMLIKARHQFLGRVQEETQLPDVVGQCGKKCGNVHIGAETDVSCHSWIQQLRADMKPLWTLSVAAKQSLPSSEEPGCEKSW